MVINRAKHAELVVEMSDKVKEMFPNTEVQDLVSKIAKAHKGPTGLDSLKVEDYCHVDGPARSSIRHFLLPSSDSRTKSPRITRVRADKFWMRSQTTRKSSGSTPCR